MDTKICPRCKETLSKDNFGKNKLKGDGLQTYCNTCRKLINNEHYATSDKRKQTVRNNAVKYRLQVKELISKHKQHGCIVCFEKEECALDFHHLDSSTKESTIANYSSKGYSFSTIENEIQKCVVLCANCHRKVHAGVITLKVNTTDKV